MAKTRLTASLREEILTKLIAKRFGEEEKALCAEAMEIGPKLYDALMGPWKEKALELPPDFMGRDNLVRKRLNTGTCFQSYWDYAESCTYTCVLPTSGYRDMLHRYPLPEAMPVPKSWPVILDDDHPVMVELVALNARAEDFIKRREAAATTVMNALKGFNTVKALVEAWPEVAPFIPDEEPAAQVPALATAELNKLLGL